VKCTQIDVPDLSSVFGLLPTVSRGVRPTARVAESSRVVPQRVVAPEHLYSWAFCDRPFARSGAPRLCQAVQSRIGENRPIPWTDSWGAGHLLYMAGGWLFLLSSYISLSVSARTCSIVWPLPELQ